MFLIKKSNLRMINYLLKHIDPKESESFHTNSPRTLSMTISGFDEKKSYLKLFHEDMPNFRCSCSSKTSQLLNSSEIYTEQH